MMVWWSFFFNLKVYLVYLKGRVTDRKGDTHTDMKWEKQSYLPFTVSCFTSHMATQLTGHNQKAGPSSRYDTGCRGQALGPFTITSLGAEVEQLGLEQAPLQVASFATVPPRFDGSKSSSSVALPLQKAQKCWPVLLQLCSIAVPAAFWVASGAIPFALFALVYLTPSTVNDKHSSHEVLTETIEVQNPKTWRPKLWPWSERVNVNINPPSSTFLFSFWVLLLFNKVQIPVFNELTQGC